MERDIIMAKRTKTPNYIKIAIDIANRVLNNDFKEVIDLFKGNEDE